MSAINRNKIIQSGSEEEQVAFSPSSVPIHDQLQKVQHSSLELDQVQTSSNSTKQLNSITIVDYDDKIHKSAFKAMSVAWISEHWELEPSDLEAFEHTQTKIIDAGGFILMAIMEHANGSSEPVGCIAMTKPLDLEKYDYELAKFTTVSAARGRGLGRVLIAEALGRAKKENKRRIYIETDSVCQAAIHLYKQFGFVRIPGKSPVYERGDMLMVLNMELETQ